MAMTVHRVKEANFGRVLMHKVADIRGGVSVKASELGGDFLAEGAIVTKPVNGICNVVKVAEVTAEVASSGVDIQVKKNHNFKVGDYVMAKKGGVAYAITKIVTTNKDHDVLTVGTTLGKITKGSFIAEAKGESSSSTSALKYAPFAVVGTTKQIVKGDNIDTDAWVIGVTKGLALPDFVAGELKGIINY